MGYASKSGRARTSASNPQAHAICDRCAFRFNHVDLCPQFQFGGAGLYNTQMLVCRECLDIPNEQLRAIVLPADPLPIKNPRVENFIAAETDFRTTSGQNTTDPKTGLPVIRGDTRITTFFDGTPTGLPGSDRVTQQTGEPPGGLNTFPGFDFTLPVSIGGMIYMRNEAGDILMYEDGRFVQAVAGPGPGLPLGAVAVPETGDL